MFVARDLHKDTEYRFRSFDALVRRLGGRNATWQTVYDPAFASPAYTVMILKPVPTGGRLVVTRVRVPREGLVQN